MKLTRILMGMPIIVEIIDRSSTEAVFEKIFDYFTYVDSKFSTYKEDSEITRINRGEVSKTKYSSDMKEVLDLCDSFIKKTKGYFNILNTKGVLDPSGLVKGWAVYNASLLLKRMGFTNFYINAGGDIEVNGLNGVGSRWSVGITHPNSKKEIVKKLFLEKGGIATSGIYERGNHIYNPHTKLPITDILSLTVIGPNVFEADVYATAAFAMGKEGIKFIENLEGFEGYMIDKDEIATFTSGFEKFTKNI